MSSFDVPQLLALLIVAILAVVVSVAVMHLRYRRNLSAGRTQAQLRNLLGQAPLASGFIDRGGRLLSLDHRLAPDTLWFDPSQSIGQVFWELPDVDRETATGLEAAYERASEGGIGTVTVECRDRHGISRRFDISFCRTGHRAARRTPIHLVIADRTQDMAQEAALELAREHYQSLLQNSSDAIFCIEYDEPGISLEWPLEQQIDALYEGRIVECNNVVARRFGRKYRNELIGKRMSDLIPRSPFGTKFLTTLAENGFEIHAWDKEAICRPDHQMEPIDHVSCSSDIRDGHVKRTWNVYRDVSDMLEEIDANALGAERRKSLLQAEEAYYCYEYSPAIDTKLPAEKQVQAILEGRLIECNASSARLSGTEDPDEIIGLTLEEVLQRSFIPVDPEKLTQRIIRFIENGYKLENDREDCPLPDGSNLASVANCRGVVKRDGLTQLWIMQLDLSDREATERELQQSEARFERMARNYPALIYRLQLSDPPELEYVNDAIKQVAGYSRNQDGLNDHVLRTVFAPENLSLLTRALESQNTDPILTRHLHQSGAIVYLEHRSVALTDSAARLTGIEGVALDVTELLNSQQQLQTALNEISNLRDELQKENVELRDAIRTATGFDSLVGSSAGFREVVELAKRAAPTASTVLIFGETGTGKELFARSIHAASGRSNTPMVSVNCAALPQTLIESELFGHVKGAFTGAHSDRIGRFEAANEGTLFLDEIAELSLDLQSKLLRVVQEGEFERIGDSETQSVDVRLIAATNQDLAAAVDRGKFRADLYYRLNVFPIEIPPLRERVEDIAVLANHFAIKHCHRLGKTFESLTPAMLRSLTSYHWPGNVRELESTIKRSIIVSPGGVLHPVELQTDRASAEAQHVDDLAQSAQTFERSLYEAERHHIIRTLEQANWVIEGPLGAANRLGIAPSTLRSKMKKLGVRRPEHDDFSAVAPEKRQVH